VTPFEALTRELRLLEPDAEQCLQLSRLACQAAWVRTNGLQSFTLPELKGRLRVHELEGENHYRVKMIRYEVRRRELGGGCWPEGLEYVHDYLR